MTIWDTVKCAFGRLFASGLPDVSGEKLCGDEGEREFCDGIEKALRKATVKQNVLLHAKSGESGEIDFLIEYDDRLFVVEVKNWNGKVIIDADGVKHYNTHGELRGDKDPFKQVTRSVMLLKNIYGVRGYIEGIVFFGGEATVDERADCGVWADDVKSLAKYIKNSDNPKFPRGYCEEFIAGLTCADYIYSESLFGDKDKHVRIVSKYLALKTDRCTREVHVPFCDIYAVEIQHRLLKDEMRIILKNGKKITGVSVGTQTIRALDYKTPLDIALSKIDGIIMGN